MMYSLRLRGPEPKLLFAIRSQSAKSHGAPAGSELRDRTKIEPRRHREKCPIDVAVADVEAMPRVMECRARRREQRVQP